MQASYRHKWLLFVLVTALVFGLTAGAFAQIDEGTISGRVVDPTGAVVPGVTVTVTSLAKGTVRTATTSPEGLYSIPNLKADTYEIGFELAGFSPLKQQVLITVGAKLDISPTLKVAGTTTTVEVTGESGTVQVQTTNAEVGQLVTSQQVAELPSLNRNPYDFASTTGNATSNAYTTERGVAGLNLNGTRATATGIQLDGAENSDLFTGSVNPGGIPMDATQEFKVVTNGMSAEYGRAGSGVVNVVSKSGSNNFHGSAYEVYRGSALASNDYNSNAFEQPKGRFVRNQFGYSFGGPIVKNKLFFYSTTEWTRVRSSANRQAYVPSTDLIGASAANTQEYMNAYGTLAVQPSSYLTIADVAARMPDVVADNPNFFALPSTMQAFGLVRYTAPTDAGGGDPQNTYNTFNRVDWTISDKTSLYGRFGRFNQIAAVGANSSSPYSAFNTSYTQVNNTLLLSLTHIFTPNLVTETKLNFNRFNQAQPLGKLGDVPNLFFNGAAPASIGGVLVGMPGYLFQYPGSTIPFGGPQNYGTVSNATTWTHGAHMLKFGGYFMYTKDNHMFGAYENAVEMLSASGWGSSLDNFLAGELANFQVAVNGGGAMPCSRNSTTGSYMQTPECTMNLPVQPASFARSNRYHDAALFVQDTWKTTNRLTLNYGIRWEYYGPQHNNKSNLDSNFYLGSGSTFFDKVANGYVTTAPNSPDKSLWAAKYTNFSPRVGFAYDVFGDGKTSLRGGFGIGYERNFGNVTYNVIQNPPAQLNLTFSSADNGGDPIPVSANNFGVFGTGTGTKLVPNVSLRAVQQDIPTSYYETWNLGMERELVKDTVLDVSYNGSHGVHLYSIANINPNYAGNVFLGYGYAGARLNTQFGAINYRGAMGGSKYNGLNVGLRSTNLKDLGLTLTANYTYSHSIDNVSTQFNNSDTTQNVNLGFTSAFYPGFDTGNSDFDLRHRFTTSMVWDLPLAKNSTGVLKAIAGGWQLTPVFSVNSGVPYSLYDCSNGYGVCMYAIFPNGGKFTGNTRGSLGQEVGTNDFVWQTFPTAVLGAYANPDVGVSDFPTCTGLEGAGCTWPTTSGRNHFRAPGNWMMDLGFGKSFKIAEKHTISFRADGFNIFNHARTYLTLPADVSSYSLADGTPYVSAYKDGRRFFNLTLRYSF